MEMFKIASEVLEYKDKASEYSRVIASEVLEYKDKASEYKETINRIVEFGRAHHVAAIVPYLQKHGVKDFIVSSDCLNLSFLKS